MYCRVIVSTYSGRSGSTMNCSGMARSSFAWNSWFVKQKHSIFWKCPDALMGATLGTACAIFVSPVRFFPQALQTDCLQVARDVAVELPGTRGVFVDDLVQEHADVAAEGFLAGEQLEQHNPHRVDIRPPVDVLTE